MTRIRRWLIGAGVAVAILLAVLGIVGWMIAKRIEPYVREQALHYLQERFGSGAELATLHVSVALHSPLALRSGLLKASGGGLVLRFHERQDLPPLIVVRRFGLETGLSSLWSSPVRVERVRLEGLEINIPPRNQREPGSGSSGKPTASSGKSLNVLPGTIYAEDALLRIYPQDKAKPPRVFEIHKLTLNGSGPGQPLRYQATLTNPRPKGIIESTGQFGPWQKEEPGQTPLRGQYTLQDADLGVFKGIAGKLQSSGKFQGVLERIEVQGETRTPDFRLRISGNPVPLTTKYDAIVDGTNGNTLLQPVRAKLGNTSFTARGGIVRHPGAKGRTVTLQVAMQKGRLEDLLRLAMKGAKPFMTGIVNLKTALEIPPGNVDIADKLALDGSFDIEGAHFAKESIQDKVDALSRRAQGQPQDLEISDVWSGLNGKFKLRAGVITFSNLNFEVPGARIDLAGSYGLETEEIDFRGTARLHAKVSQTMTGWKRWVLKPVDPFFSKQGAGTLLPIKVTGTRSKPEFGLDRKKKKSSG